MSERLVAVRADFGWEVGSGHVMRCLALAQALQASGWRVSFLLSHIDGAVPNRLRTECFEVERINGAPGSTTDAAATAEWCRRTRPAWIVLDGYSFGDAYESAIRPDVERMLSLDDDGHATHALADVVVNQNHGAVDLFHRERGFGGRALFGSKYAMLRREFIPYRQWSRKVESRCRNVLIAFGGSDPLNVAELALTAFLDPRLADVSVVALCGADNPNLARLQDLKVQLGDRAILLERSDNMPGLMVEADLALGAAGATTWERAFLGLPTIAFVLSANQEIVGRAIEREKIGLLMAEGSNGVDLDKIADHIVELSENQRMRTEMARRGQALIDGRGADRVARCMADLAA